MNNYKIEELEGRKTKKVVKEEYKEKSVIKKKLYLGVMILSAIIRLSELLG